jgi:hypothetical protein
LAVLAGAFAGRSHRRTRLAVPPWGPRSRMSLQNRGAPA